MVGDWGSNLKSPCTSPQNKTSCVPRKRRQSMEPQADQVYSEGWFTPRWMHGREFPANTAKREPPVLQTGALYSTKWWEGAWRSELKQGCWDREELGLDLKVLWGHSVSWEEFGLRLGSEAEHWDRGHKDCLWWRRSYFVWSCRHFKIPVFSIMQEG